MVVDLLLVEVGEHETFLTLTATERDDGIHGNSPRVAMETWSLVFSSKQCTGPVNTMCILQTVYIYTQLLLKPQNFFNPQHSAFYIHVALLMYVNRIYVHVHLYMCTMCIAH